MPRRCPFEALTPYAVFSNNFERGAKYSSQEGMQTNNFCPTNIIG
jgi:hypothetical protein